MNIIEAKTVNVASISGFGSGQTEEIDLLFTYKKFDLEAEAVIPDTTVQKRFVVNRSTFFHTVETFGTTNRINFYAGPVLLETINTDDYDWFNETNYSPSNINDIANAVYSALSF